ncbi:hypothetical protein [Dactylosporangium darangshiense]
MPGKTMAMVEHFIADLRRAAGAATAVAVAAVRTVPPSQRHGSALAPIATSQDGSASC